MTQHGQPWRAFYCPWQCTVSHAGADCKVRSSPWRLRLWRRVNRVVYETSLTSHARQEKTTSPHGDISMLLDSSIFWSTRSVLGYVHRTPPCEFAVHAMEMLDFSQFCRLIMSSSQWVVTAGSIARQYPRLALQYSRQCGHTANSQGGFGCTNWKIDQVDQNSTRREEHGNIPVGASSFLLSCM